MPRFDLARIVIGQRQATSVLERSLETDRLSHAYLLVGPARVGKTTIALAIARALNCDGESRPCGVCRPCRLAVSGGYSDLRLIQSGDSVAAAGKKSGGERGAAHRIGIEQVRALQHDAALAPVEGRLKVYVIADAPLLTEDAANCLLKTLEEPPAHVLLILTATDAESLLPTIVSRCRVIRLAHVATADLASALVERHGASPERADLLARLSGGCPGWALGTLDDSSVLDERARRLEELATLVRAGRVERLSFAEKLAQEHGRDPERVYRALGLWLGYWRDVRLASLGCDELVVNADRLDEIKARARTLRTGEIARAGAGVGDALTHLSKNVNARLAFDVMLLGLPAA